MLCNVKITTGNAELSDGTAAGANLIITFSYVYFPKIQNFYW